MTTSLVLGFALESASAGVRWDRSKGAMLYNVWRRFGDEPNQLRAATTESEWTDGVFPSAVWYTYVVTAKDVAALESEPSVPMILYVRRAYPAKPRPRDPLQGAAVRSTKLRDVAEGIRARLRGDTAGGPASARHLPDIADEGCVFCHFHSVEGRPHESWPVFVAEWRERMPDIFKSPAGLRDRRFCLTCHEGTYAQAVSREHGQEWTPVASVTDGRASGEIACVTCHNVHAYRRDNPGMVRPGVR